MPIKNDAPKMKGQRGRNKDGALRKKRSDTHIKTIEDQYNVDLNVRGDKHLGTHRKDKGVDSLKDIIKRK